MSRAPLFRVSIGRRGYDVKGGGQLKRHCVVVFVGIETHPILVWGIFRLYLKIVQGLPVTEKAYLFKDLYIEKGRSFRLQVGVSVASAEGCSGFGVRA